jgi:hypothetical protein
MALRRSSSFFCISPSLLGSHNCPTHQLPYITAPPAVSWSLSPKHSPSRPRKQLQLQTANKAQRMALLSPKQPKSPFHTSYSCKQPTQLK